MLHVKKGRVGNLSERDGILYDTMGRVYVPGVAGLRQELVHSVHVGPLGGHRHEQELLRALREIFVFEGMHAMVKKVTDSCLACLRNKVFTAMKAPPVARRVPLLPFSELHVDEVAGLPTVRGVSSAWVVMDRLTGFLFAFSLPSPCDAKTLARLMIERVFSVVGLPFKLVSDADSRLTGDFFEALHDYLQVKHEVVSKGNHRANGVAERVIRTLKEYIRVCCNNHRDDWMDLLP